MNEVRRTLVVVASSTAVWLGAVGAAQVADFPPGPAAGHLAPGRSIIVVV